MLDSTTLADVMDMLPDPFTATLTPYNGGIAAMMISGARYRPLKRSELTWAASIGLTLATRVFLLPAVNITSGYQIIENDVLTDDAGQKWNITDAALQMQGTIWRCIATQAPIAP